MADPSTNKNLLIPTLVGNEGDDFRRCIQQAPNERISVVDGDGDTKMVDGVSQICFPTHGTASKISLPLPDETKDGLSKIDLENATETGTFGLSRENGKKVGASLRESTTGSPAVKLRRSNRTGAQLDKARQSQWHQPVQQNNYSRGALNKGRNRASPALKQVWRVKEKTEPSKDSCKSSSKVLPVKVTDPAKDSFKLPSKVWQVKQQAETSKDSSLKSSSNSWLAKEQTEMLKSSKLSSKARHVNEKQKVPQGSYKSSSRKKATRKCSEQYVQYRIMWEGEQQDQQLGQDCLLCEIDLAYSPEEPNEHEFKSENFPDTAVLPCGHIFHLECLQLAMSESQLQDPPCFICESLT